MTARLTALAAMFLLALFCAVACAAETGPADMMAFADHLFDQADYYRAITEYERVIFHFPGHALAKTARYRIAHSYFRGDKLAPAIERFRTLATDFPAEATGRDSLFMLAEAQYLSRDYRASQETFAAFLAAYPDDPRRDKAAIRNGWAHLRQGDWRGAETAFQSLPPGSPLRPAADDLADGARRYPELPKKSPALAGALSALLPGAGQLYTNRTGDAITSFLLNGIFLWGAVEAFRHDNNVTGGILLFFEAGWYAGNIYNAAGNAHKFNQRTEKSFLNRLEESCDISFSRTSDGTNFLAISLRY